MDWSSLNFGKPGREKYGELKEVYRRLRLSVGRENDYRIALSHFADVAAEPILVDDERFSENGFGWAINLLWDKGYPKTREGKKGDCIEVRLLRRVEGLIKWDERAEQELQEELERVEI